MPQIHRETDQCFEARRCKSQMGAWLEPAFGNGKQIPLHGPVLSVHLFAVIGEHAFYRPQQSLAHRLEVAVRSECQADFVPNEVGAWNLPEYPRGRLEYNRVREGHYASRR